MLHPKGDDLDEAWVLQTGKTGIRSLLSHTEETFLLKYSRLDSPPLLGPLSHATSRYDRLLAEIAILRWTFYPCAESYTIHRKTSRIRGTTVWSV